MRQGNAFQLNVETQGRLTDPEQFADVVIRTDADGRQVRVSRRRAGRARRAGLRHQHLSQRQADGDRSRVFQRPGSNALAAAEAVHGRDGGDVEAASPRASNTGSSTTRPSSSRQSIDAVKHTLVEAIVLVVLVILVFLQNWRAAIIPIVAIPVSLIGTFAVLAALGYSLNNLSLFGLVLAIGIVVDDAIVVVENVERNLEHGLSPLEAARTSMDEVSGALVAIVLVLCAVFVPTLFLTGLSGAFYRQFAVTISTATIISLLALADPVAGARRAAAASRTPTARAGNRAGRASCRRAGDALQPRLRAAERRLCRAHRARWSPRRSG